MDCFVICPGLIVEHVSQLSLTFNCYNSVMQSYKIIHSQ